LGAVIKSENVLGIFPSPRTNPIWKSFVGISNLSYNVHSVRVTTRGNEDVGVKSEDSIPKKIAGGGNGLSNLTTSENYIPAMRDVSLDNSLLKIVHDKGNFPSNRMLNTNVFFNEVNWILRASFELFDHLRGIFHFYPGLFD
jgi:hypothetical protein